MKLPSPTLLPLGSEALLVRFSERLDLEANAAAINLAGAILADPPPGMLEVSPNLVSVLVRYDPGVVGYQSLAGEIRLRINAVGAGTAVRGATHRILVRFGGEDGPDFDAVCKLTGLAPGPFIAAHNRYPMRALAVGFAPGFVYCGMHDNALTVPRRETVRRGVAAGSILFAAGQTAIAATEVPTGWHVIGRTDFRNFDPMNDPPCAIAAGDTIQFEVHS